MIKSRPQVNYELCMACGICAHTCPFTCLEMSKLGVDSFKKTYPVLVLPDRCTGCSMCKNACPVDAIQM